MHKKKAGQTKEKAGQQEILNRKSGLKSGTVGEYGRFCIQIVCEVYFSTTPLQLQLRDWPPTLILMHAQLP